MTELDFLLELLINHKIGKATKDAIKYRIGEIQKGPRQITIPAMAHGSMQAPSTIAAMAKHGMLEQPPVEVLGQTPAANAALVVRAQMINSSMAGKHVPKTRQF